MSEQLDLTNPSEMRGAIKALLDAARDHEQRLAALERQYLALGRSVAESGLVIAQRLNALEAENRRLTAITAAAHQEVQGVLARVEALEMQVEMDREKLVDHSTRSAATEAVERGGSPGTVAGPDYTQWWKTALGFGYADREAVLWVLRIKSLDDLATQGRTLRDALNELSALQGLAMPPEGV